MIEMMTQKKSRLPSQRRQRQTIVPRVYEDQWGITAIVEVAPFRPLEKRFPLGTNLDDIQAWQLRTRADLLEQAPAPLQRGTLAADVPRFLETLPAGAARDEYTYLLQAWVDALVPGETITFGAMRRDKIRRPQIRAQLKRWTAAPSGPSRQGFAASTVNHRLRALRALYLGLDGEDAASPCDRIKKLAAPKDEPRDIPVALVEWILGNMPDRGRPVKGQTTRNGAGRSRISHSKIRLRVMAWTGLPQMQLERLRPRDVRFTTGELYRRPRRKGEGVKGSWTGLIPPAIDALRDYAAANLWGRSFSRQSLNKTWKRALMRTMQQAEARGDEAARELLRTAVPENCRAYDLKHAFASEALRQTGDLLAVKELLQHASLTTTQRYTEGAVSERVQLAIEKMSERWRSPSVPVPPKRLRLVE
jgi:integrase